MDAAGSVLDAIAGYMDEEELVYHRRKDAPIIDTGFAGRTGHYRIVLYVGEGPSTILSIVLPIPEVVQEEHRPRMAETVVRANYGLPLGGFELDMSDGEILFRVALPVADGFITREQFLHLLAASSWALDTYSRAFKRLIYGDDLSAAEVIAEVEMAAAQDPDD